MAENDQMQAVSYHRFGGPEELMLETLPRPVAGPGTVLVRVKAAAVDPVDWKLRSGALQQFMPVPLPMIPGIELAGVVEEIGPGVSGFAVGEAVYAATNAANAEYAAVPATSLAPMPRNLSFDQAAAVPVGVLTAWRGLFDQAGLQAGPRVLVQGAAGGVGSFAVQLAHGKGAYVIGTASARNQHYVRDLGADEVIDYQATPFETVVHDVDIVLDTVGGPVGERSLQVLRPGGLLVTVAGQPPAEQAAAAGRRAVPAGRADPAQSGARLQQIGELIESGQLKVAVATVLPLAEVARGHILSQTGHGQGRIVLHVAD